MNAHEAFEIHAPKSGHRGRWIVTADHASNRIPDWVEGGCLGLCPEDMERHIAFDPGAGGVARGLSQHLNGQAVLGRFSRLVVDPNRGEDDPTLIMKLYDGSVIPANRHLTHSMQDRRLERLYRPYHHAVDRAITSVEQPIIVSVHTFTAQLRGQSMRPWHVGLLSADDRRLADPMLGLLKGHGDLCVGDNEPYTGALAGDAMDKHGVSKQRPHILIEIRNDLVETETQQQEWANRLASVLVDAAAIAGL